jgi:YgiT-type zinc finger domain-containing protein
MTGERVKNKGRCPLCGGALTPHQKATIPFVLDNRVVVIKDVPAEVCGSCREPYLTGQVTDQVMTLLSYFRNLPVEVSVASYDTLAELKRAAYTP